MPSIRSLEERTFIASTSDEIIDLNGFRFHDREVTIFQGKNILARYHRLPRINLNSNYLFGDYSIGFEVEKEDSNVSLDYREIFKLTNYSIERDGSLDLDTGYELISPILPFNINVPIYLQNDWINKYINPIEHLLNANASDRCGFHLHVSHKEKDKFYLYEEFKYVSYILYALFPERTTNRYCKAVKHGNNCDKYVAVAIRKNTIEFRIFPKLESFPQLLDRLELIRLILNVSPVINSFEKLYSDLEFSDLRRHIETKFNINYDSFINNLIEFILKV